MDSHILDFVKLIRRKYVTVGSKLKPLDMAQIASFLTMDVITDVAFGQTWGCLEKDEDVFNWFESMEQFLPIAIRTATIPWIANLFLFSIPFVGKMIMPSDKDEIGPEKLVGITKGLVRKLFALKDPGHARDI